MNGMHILEYLHDRGRSIGLEIGANFGKITARAVTVVLRWNTHHRTRRHVSCSSGCRSRWRIKIGRFFWSAAKCLSLKSGTLLIKYLESGCKIGGKKCHQWLERPWQVKISYITQRRCIQNVLMWKRPWKQYIGQIWWLTIANDISEATNITTRYIVKCGLQIYLIWIGGKNIRSPNFSKGTKETGKFSEGLSSFIGYLIQKHKMVTCLSGQCTL